VLLRVIETSALAFTGDAAAGISVNYKRLFDMLRDDAERYLTSWANGLRGREVTVETSVVAGIAADAIVAAARTHPGTLLVLSTHGRTGWRAVALGSVARRVVALAGSPVLIARAR
jgi:nucleotide-binding universal stress UspA family protein